MKGKFILHFLFSGVDPTCSSDYLDCPVYLATTSNRNVRILEKFLDYLTPHNINTKDQDTGQTLLHHAVSNCTTEIIQTIIAKGADLLLEDNKECLDACNKKNESSKLPLQVAIANKRSK